MYLSIKKKFNFENIMKRRRGGLMGRNPNKRTKAEEIEQCPRTPPPAASPAPSIPKTQRIWNPAITEVILSSESEIEISDSSDQEDEQPIVRYFI